MRILIAAATGAEVAPFVDYMHNSGRPGEVVLITGVGMMATAFSLGRHLASNKYDLVIQAGVGGSFDRSIPLGSLVLVTSEQYGDLGAEDKGAHIDIFELGLLERNSIPHTDGKLINPVSAIHEKIDLPPVSAITVNSVSGSESTIQRRLAAYNPQVESMEGAAFHYVCLQEDVPFAQVRAISNYVTPRDKSQWKMKEAIINLNEWLIGFVERL